jgi:hypothetical protein
VEAITFGRSTSSGLRAVVDDFIDLDDDPAKYLIGYRPVRKNSQRPRNGKTSKNNRGTQVVGSDTDGLL